MPKYTLFQKILDFISYALIPIAPIFVLLDNGEINIGGEINLIIGLFDRNNISGVLLAILLIFLLNLGVIYLIYLIYQHIKNKYFLILTSSLIATFYFQILIEQPGGWITTTSRGITGFFLFDLIILFLAGIVIYRLLMLKNELHKKFNSSVLLFLIVLIYTLVFIGYNI